jgi:hypothetical protein
MADVNVVVASGGITVIIGEGAAVLAAIATTNGRIDAAQVAIAAVQAADEARDQESQDRDTAIGGRIDGLLGGVSAAFNTFAKIVAGFVPRTGGITLSGSLGFGGNRVQTVGDAQDDADAMNRRMVTDRTDPLAGGVSRTFTPGFMPGSTVPIDTATVDANGFLLEANGRHGFEPETVVSTTDAVLIPAADIDLGGGLLTRLPMATVTSPAPATAGNQRKDIVSVNPSTGVVALTQGTERSWASAYWTGAIPAGNIEIGRILRTSASATYTPTWRRRAGAHPAQGASDVLWLEASRVATARTRSRLVRGLPVRFILHGDSRMAMGTNNSFAQYNIHPNSDATASPAYLRDVPGFFALYDTDTRAQVLDQKRDFNDGYGAVHAREGYCWRFARALEAAYGFAFDASTSPAAGASTYRNWAVPGTTSGVGYITSDSSGNQRANGREPVRLNAVLADIVAGQTLVILGFGMNELGSTDTYGNLRALTAACLAAGAEVLVVSTTRPVGTFNGYGQAVRAWRYTCRETVRAAMDASVAWVDAADLVAPEWLPSIGVSEAELSDATNQNHEGVNIQAPLGQRMARIFLGA